MTHTTNITIAVRCRAMDYLVTARLVRRGYADGVIHMATRIARKLHTDGHRASRAMRLAVSLAERLHLSSSPVTHGPHAA